MAEPRPTAPAGQRPEIRVFLQEIKGHPDDDTPRLVLADWLEEHGDPAEAARGEVVRIGVLLHRMPAGDPRRPALGRRLGELILRHLDAWVGRLADFAIWRFERGFLHLEARAPKLFRSQVAALATPEMCDWVEALKLDEVEPPHLARLVASPLLPCIHTLDLGDNRLPGEALDVLLRSPGVSGLRTLLLDGNRIGPEGARALASSPHLAGLTTLDLSGNRIGDGGARWLAESPDLQSLASLWVRGNALGGEGQASLCKRFGAGVRLHERRRPAPE